MGYEFQNAEIIAGPADWSTVEAAAHAHAAANHLLVSIDAYQETVKQREVGAR